MHTNGLRVGIENRYVCGYCGAIRKALANHKIGIDRRKEGWDPQVPGPLAKWPADEVARGDVVIT